MNATDRHTMLILRQSMLDPALSGGSPLLAELCAAIADDDVGADALLREVPPWKIPGLLLSAALLHDAAADPAHPLARFVAGGAAVDGSFRDAVRAAITTDAERLSALLARHTYQCNPPRRMAVSLIALAASTRDWDWSRPALHVDLGTASGIGLLLGQVRAVCGEASIGPADAVLELPLGLRGAPLDVASLPRPRLERSVGVDLDPPDLRDPACRAWMRACQFPMPAELAWFDRAVDLVLEQRPRIERGSATDWLPRLSAEMPSGQPLVVTDTYVAVFMSEDEREHLRRELDEIARVRPLVWVSNDPVVPLGDHPERTTAGLPVTPELVERNRREMFGTVCATTWPDGTRTPRLLAVTHPGGCWLDWRAPA